MYQVNLPKLQQLLKYVGTTSCGETQDFVGGAVLNNWDKHKARDRNLKDYFNEAWSSLEFVKQNTEHYEIFSTDCTKTGSVIYGRDLPFDLSFSAADISELIVASVHKYGIISLDFKHDYDHAMSLCTSDSGIVIIDSYAVQRYPEVRPFDVVALHSFLECPSLDTYTKFSKSQHTKYNREIYYTAIGLSVPSGKEIIIQENTVIV